MASLCKMFALRFATLLGVMGHNHVFARSSQASRFDRRQAHDDDDDDDDDEDDDDDDIDEDGEDGTHTHHSTRTSTHSSTSSPTGSSTVHSSVPPTTLSDGLSTSSPGDMPTSLSSDRPSGPSSGWTNSWTSPGTSSTSTSVETSAGSNAAISATEGGITKGSIAGIVIGSGIVLVIAFYIARCMRHRYAQSKRKQLEKKDLLLGPPLLKSTHPTDTKDPVMTTANVASSQPYALYRTASRDTLPQIPFDTPAYMSTDNLASYTYAQMHAQRTSTVLSYDCPSDPTEMSNSSAVRESEGGFGHANLHEDMLARQKALEAHMERMHGSHDPSSDGNYSSVTVNPPPTYREH